MILNIIRLIAAVLCIYSLSAFAYEAVTQKQQISVAEFQTNGSKYVGNDVSLMGFLMIDEGMFLYPNLDSFIGYDLRSSVYFTVSDYKKYDALSGCFVSLVGTVGTHKVNKNAYVISKIKSMVRTGSIYQIAREKGKDNLKCEIDAIVEVM